MLLLVNLWREKINRLYYIKEYELIIIIFIILLITLLIKKKKKNQIYISKLDNKYYIVNNLSEKEKVSFILSKIRNKIIYLTENFSINTNNEPYILNIKKKIYKTKFIQNKNKFPQKSKISYSINKGEEIILCVYDYNINKFYDINVLIYVSIHELAHIANPTIGHDESFYFIFNNLLEEAIRLKVYQFYDYEKIPTNIVE